MALNLGTIGLNLVANTDKFTKGMKRAQAGLAKAEKATKEYGASVDKFAKQYGQMSDRYQKLMIKEQRLLLRQEALQKKGSKNGTVKV